MVEERRASQGSIEAHRLSVRGSLGSCDVPNVVTISNEKGTRSLGQIAEFHQYRTPLEWAISSKNAGELFALPKQFRKHFLHPFLNAYEPKKRNSEKAKFGRCLLRVRRIILIPRRKGLAFVI
jgi:hypothetical protein